LACPSRSIWPGGEVDRVTLRQRIFEDAEVRHQVDTLLHPLAREAMRTQVELVQAPLVLVEIPLLYEAGWRAEVDAVLVVYARRGVRCCRIMRRDRVSRRDATRAIVAQMSLEEKAARAEYLLENSREWAVTRTRVVSLGNTLSERFQSFFCPESS
jgi:dephospho-CoA kinase